MSNQKSASAGALPPEACEHVNRALNGAADRFSQALSSLPTQPVPEALGQAVSTVLDAFDEVLSGLCGSADKVPRHHSAVRNPLQGCSAPLRLTRADAEAIYDVFRAEEERLNETVEKIKLTASSVDFEDWGPLFARAMGMIYIEILRPLQHQYPEVAKQAEPG